MASLMDFAVPMVACLVVDQSRVKKMSYKCNVGTDIIVFSLEEVSGAAEPC
ncbi:hypothetical protein [Escherichia sp. E1S7]|uniref:hypothetical protein n=1 Tax=Escherichia sp. E1S7 TaxID=2478969 RepID=UPI00196AB7D9|nr:hypothetical protein [Escherichia sp. E1S7]